MLISKTAHEKEEQRLLERWDWITESIEDYDTRLNTSIILENTYDKMVKEGQVPSNWLEKALNEETLNEADPEVATTALGVNLIPKVMFPLIRRVFPTLIANKLVSVQPLSQPTGVIYYMKYGYDTTKGDMTAGSEYSALPQEANNAFSTFFSSERIGPYTAQIGAANVPTAITLNTASFLGTSFTATQIKRVEVYNVGIVGVPAYNTAFGQSNGAVSAVTATETNNMYTAPPGYVNNQQPDPPFPVNTTKPYYPDMYGATRLVGAQYRVNFGVGSAVTAGTNTDLLFTTAAGPNVQAYLNPNVSSQGVLYLQAGFNGTSTTATTLGPWPAGSTVKVFIVYNQEASSLQPAMNFSIGSQTVQTTERKLRVSWTKEAEQDMRAFQKIDVEAELVKMASMEMNYEIDREVLAYIGDQVDPNLSYLHTWDNDAVGNGSGGGGNNSTGNFLDRHRALWQKTTQLCAKIAQYNRLGPANWAVCSPQIAALLQMLPDWKGEIAGPQGFTVTEAGKIGGTVTVYIDPNRLSNDILLGYKNTNSTYGAGVVYAPYTNWMSNTVTDPANFNSIRGFFSRYALTTVNRGQFYYGRVTLADYLI